MFKYRRSGLLMALAPFLIWTPSAVAQQKPAIIKPLAKHSAQVAPATSKKLIIVEFYSERCAPCKLFSPVWNSVSQRYRAKAEFKRVSTASNDQMMQRYGQYVNGTPTVVWINGDGKFLTRTGWFNSDKDFIEAIDYIRKKYVDG